MINVVIVLKRDFSHVLYLHYSFLAYDSIKTIMSMIIIELIITMILIMFTIVIYWNVIGVLAALFSQIILYSCNKTDKFRPNISRWDNVERKKFPHFGNYPFFFFRISGCCYGYWDQLCNCLVKFWCALAQILTVIRQMYLVFSEVVTVMISWQ